MTKEFPKKIADNVMMHSADPILYVVNEFLSNDECDAFIEASKGKLKPSTVISPDKHIQHESRTSENCWICLLYTSPSPRDRQKSRMPSSA